MAECSITSVQILNNPAPFTEPIVLEVQYECLSSLQEDLEWKVIYVGSANDETQDQVLDSALVGPVQPGNFKFRMEAPAPDHNRIHPDELMGVTILLLTCSYKGEEFVRVGYYVNIEVANPELLDPNNPNAITGQPSVDQLQRNIMADHPRVTKFPHNFDNVPQEQLPTDAEPEPDADDLLPEDDEGEEDDYEDYYEEDDEEGGMKDDEVDLQADEGLENRDPNGRQAAGGAAGAQLQGKAAGLAAAVADAGAGVEDMEL